MLNTFQFASVHVGNSFVTIILINISDILYGSNFNSSRLEYFIPLYTSIYHYEPILPRDSAGCHFLCCEYEPCFKGDFLFSQVLHGASCIASNTHIPRVLLPKCSGYMYLLHISVPQSSDSWVT